ncbi:hypothetical protein A2634_00805 [Candidatus Amesbacteria bacterium RIFCSPHIGHO2_01_FULL_48_32]|uniref:Nucleotidase n=1 Tax=Candidatus Amesbacteria bacterium RIFCSPLOWO2_01_FULL_48_25 TaxID=1797259 RepID=A0A1F4ZAW8_9BACT|nr:MAG: hypothetical protein A2634_00805 [Candidatus Amesbacteria bacterium RIFCSPHIGHO2_01_FULL_48_32]OGD03345.1 MAG: hypothetical protein A2989_00755 [Candidatus Amesbacteria bacterium RIFCSPLOWO2_01_FULL_48_25]
MKKLRVGLDFDGVVAYNPFRVVRAPIKWFKREILGIRRLTFFVPKNWWQRFLWSIVHESSIWPATGVDLLRIMAQNPHFEFHLITARFGFLKGNLYNWLEKNDLKDIFKTINVNENYEQPHEYKLRVVKQLQLDYYVEDNLDVVVFLRDKARGKVFWIYNFMDVRHPYPHKFPYLKRALEEIK